MMSENGPVRLTADGKHRLEEKLKQLKADFENAQEELDNASDFTDRQVARERKLDIQREINETERILSHCTIIETKSELEKRLEELKFTERAKALEEKMDSSDALDDSRKEYGEALDVQSGLRDEIRELEERLTDCVIIEDRLALEKKLSDLENEKTEAVKEWNRLRKRPQEIDAEKTSVEYKLKHGITKKEKADYENRLSQLQAEKAELNEKKKKAAEVKSATNAEYDKAVEKQKDLESRIKPIRDKFDHGLNFFDKLRRSSLEKELAGLKTELSQTTDEEIKLSEEYNSASAEYEAAAKKLSGINREVQEIQKNLTDVVIIKDRAELQKSLSDLNNEKLEVAEKQKKAGQRKTDAEAAIEEIRKQLEKAVTADEKSDCEKKLGELKEEKRKADSDFTFAEKKYNGAKADNRIAEARLDEIDNEMKEIKDRLSRTRPDDGIIRLGSSVTYRNLKSGKDRTVRIVSAAESDFGNGCISDVSPTGSSLLGHKAGETVPVKEESGAVKFKVRILSVN